MTPLNYGEIREEEGEEGEDEETSNSMELDKEPILIQFEIDKQ